MSKEDKGPTLPEIACSFLRKYGMRHFDGTEKKILVKWRGDFYLWSGGAYEQLDEDMLKAMVVKHLNNVGQIPTINMVGNILLNVASHITIDKNRKPNTWLTDQVNMDVPINTIITESGMVTIAPDGQIEVDPITPDFFSLDRLPYGYDPKADCPRWRLFMEEITMGDIDLQRMLQQWMGYTLSPGQRYQSFLVMLGESATGKGTYSRALIGMLGRKNCTDLAARRFTEQFALYPTYGKKLNIVGDADSELNPRIEEVIKNWTGKDGLEFEKKYGISFFDTPTAKLMILTNEFPTFTDKSGGTWRRLLIAPTDREDRDVVDPDLDDKLGAELPGILNWAIKGLIDLERNRGFVRPTRSLSAWETYKGEANPAKLFLLENYLWKPGYVGGVKTTAVYTAYRQWCKERGYQPFADRKFGREIFRAFPKTIKRKLGTKSRYYVYTGIFLQPNAELLDS